MKQIKLFGILFFSFLLLFATSCKKFEEGGNTANAKKKLIGTWSLVKYEENGQDKTNINPHVELEVRADETFKRTFMILTFQTYDEGTWTLIDNKTGVVLTKTNGDLEGYTILKLTNKDLKVENKANNPKLVYTFEKK